MYPVQWLTMHNIDLDLVLKGDMGLLIAYAEQSQNHSQSFYGHRQHCKRIFLSLS